MTTLIKTSKNIATSLSGSAFRRFSLDGRTRWLKTIPTWGGRKAEGLSHCPKNWPRPPRSH